MKLINWIKNDYRNVNEAIDLAFDGSVPKWIIVPYYVIIGIAVLPLMPFLHLAIGIMKWKMKRDILKYERELED